MNLSSPLVLSYKGLIPDPELLDWLAEGKVRGVVLFRDNCADEVALRESISRMRRAAREPIFIMIDEEGGRVRRLPDAPSSMQDLREYESRPDSEIAEHYASVARRLKSLGIDTLLAPVVDIGHEGAEWLNSRTISEDKRRVMDMASAVIPAIQAEGIHACAKHFPGSGRVALDPHHGPATCPITPGQWDAHERKPFERSIVMGVDMILVGHQIMEGFGHTLPASFTPVFPKRMLRKPLQFEGLVLTDDLAMGAIARAFPIERAIDLALGAGCDLALICNDRGLQRRAVLHAMKANVST